VLAVEHGDRVVDDLGPLREDALPPCAEPRDPHELSPAQVRGEQVEELARGPRGRPRLLELGARVASRQLELPQARTVLHAVPERDPMPREPQVLRVVVRRHEVARGLRLPERWKLEPLAGNQLHLALNGLAHLPERTRRKRERAAPVEPPPPPRLLSRAWPT
jgi:hypothetical protein